MASGSHHGIANSNAVDAQGASSAVRQPVDCIGTRTLPSRLACANDHIRPITIPAGAARGRVLVGQRKEPFCISIGQIFDLLAFQTLREGPPPRPFAPVGGANAAVVRAPTLFPRSDLVATFLTGLNLPGVASTQPRNVRPSEMLRPDTATPPVPFAQQNRLGVPGGNVAGLPSGRRPADGIIDLTLGGAMGRPISLGAFGQPAQAPSGALGFTDAAVAPATSFLPVFPCLAALLSGDLAQ